MDRSGLRRVWWLGLLAFFLLAAGWALATPYDGAYDEHDHVVRAAGVVRGQLLVAPSGPDNERFQTVPRSLIPPNFDCLRTPVEPATCLGEPPADRTPTRVPTRAGHYDPVYYALVGWPLLPLPTMAGVILARLLNALLCAGFLATALVTIWPIRRRRLLMLALLLATTPTLISLNGLVNPSGLEISAAILLWAALGRLLSRDPPDRDTTDDTTDDGDTHRLTVWAGVAATTLALIRPAGLAVLGAVALLTVVALADRARVREILRRRDVRVALLVTAVAGALVIAWTLAAQVAALGTESPPDQRRFTELVRIIVLSRFDYWLRQTVGIFGYATVNLPVWVMAAWGTVQGLLVVVGVAFARRRHAAAIAIIPVACLLGGLVVELVSVRVVGFFMQGRYFMPVWDGMFFLAALAVPARLLPAAGLRRIHAVALAVWAGSGLLGLYLTVHHFEVGQQSTAAYPAGWHPAVGQVTPLIVTAAGIVVTAWLVHRYLAAARTDDDVAGDAADDGSGPGPAGADGTGRGRVHSHP